MRSGQAAKALGVDKKTVTNWIAHPKLEQFFSPSAAGRGEGVEREISEDELYILNTVRTLRANMARNNTDWQLIADKLTAGYRDKVLPPQAVGVDTGINPLAQYDQIKTIMHERDFAQRRVTELEQLLSDREAKIDQMHERLLQEIGDMKAQLARAETELEYWRSGRLRPE